MATATAVLIDLDHLSYEEAGGGRVADASLEASLDSIRLGLKGMDCDVFFVYCACSTATLEHHWRALVSPAQPRWCACRGLDGADRELLREMSFLRERGRAERVVIVGGDGIYADSLKDFSLAGIESWVVGRRGSVSSALRRAAHRHLDLRDLARPVLAA